MTAPIYKLADAVEWDAARATGAYPGSALDRADGFIHFSTTAQLAETARKHYRGRPALILAEIDPSKAGEVVWEPSRGGDLFPHLYVSLPFAAVRAERRLSVDPDGVMRFEDGAVGWP